MPSPDLERPMYPVRARASLLLALLALLALVGSGCTSSLSARAKGASAPKTRECTLGQRVELENGDFTIVQNCADPADRVVGDGVLETTLWEFDLSDADVASCYPERAVIEMRLRPTGDLLGERLRVRDRWAMGLEEIQSLEVGKEQSMTVDMMVRNGRPSPYTPSAIRDILVQGGGILPMSYELNALVSYAELTLHCRD